MIYSALEEIAIAESTNLKFALLSSNKENDLMERAFKLSYSPQINFGIKKIPAYSDVEGSMTLEEAFDVLEFKLATREVTGNAAIKLLADTLTRLSIDDQEVVKRVIKKDLECGLGSTIANKVWKNLIPKLPQMLAQPMSEKTLANIVYPAMAQLKADGARCIAVVLGDTIDDVFLYSRAYNQYLMLDDVKRELLILTAEYRKQFGKCVVDGELVYVQKSEEDTGLGFLSGEVSAEDVVLRSESNGIANKSLKGTISPEEADCMSYQVWDIYTYEESFKGKKNLGLKYGMRWQWLCHLFSQVKLDKLLLIPSHVVNNIDEARAIYKNYVNQGLEGIILKNIKANWEDKRSKNQVKFKEEITIDLEIVGFYPHKKDENKLGGIELKSKCGKITVNCGSGFTDTDKYRGGVNKGWIDIPIEERDDLNRSKLWHNRESLIGKIAEIKSNGWINAEHREDTVGLFLPIILAIREDKTEANTFEDVFGE